MKNILTFQHFNVVNVVAVVLLLSGSLMATWPPGTAQAETIPDWRETGLTLPTGSPLVCIDGAQPNLVLVAAKPSNSGPGGTFAYNWQSGQKTLLNDQPYTQCQESTGQLFVTARGVEGARRFSSLSPASQVSQYAPTDLAGDGTGLLYSITARRLYVSPDGGATWQERGLPLAEKFQALSVSGADPQAVYALLRERPRGSAEYIWTIYFSADAGQTFERRYEARLSENVTLALAAELGRQAPVGTLLLYRTTKKEGGYETLAGISSDGGRSFKEAYTTARNYQPSTPQNREMFYTPAGFLRFTDAYTGNLKLDFSPDGLNWQGLALPEFKDSGKRLVLQQADNAPATFLLYAADGTGDLWLSANTGQDWQRLAKNMPDLLITPYAPFTLLGIKSRKIYSLELPQVGQSLTGPTGPTASGRSLFFAPTRHNLAPVFRRYWQETGGLAQFGYPKTEPFRELNPTDARIYTVQYFERNRFEYHPENGGTKYEVLLGLLGNQVTEPQRLKGNTAFTRVANANYAGGLYFPETAHNLHGSFRIYWETHGGLALYGYPISEEITEINPDDGKSYLVQYFERNRFEYHPENSGTAYEVLLGLLGNSLLIAKGWL